MKGNALARRALLVSSLVAGLLVPLSGETASACVSGHGRGYLDFSNAQYASGLGASSPFFYTPEGTDAVATVRVTGGCWDAGEQVPPTRVNFVTNNGSALGGVDFTDTDGQSAQICDDAHYDGLEEACRYGGVKLPRSDQIEVSTTDDSGGGEAAVESFEFRLTGTDISPGAVAGTYIAPVHVIDADGSSRFSLEPNLAGTAPVTYSRSESFLQLRVAVFRAGDASVAASIPFSVTGSGANPATAGSDFAVNSPSPLPFAPNDRVEFIDIRIENDQDVEPAETFDIALGAGSVSPTTTTVTILDNDSDAIEPQTRWHHPKQGLKYRYRDYRIREMHAFFSDQGGSQVVGVEMALRKKRKNGSCAWYESGRWYAGGCDQKRWIPMKLDFDLYLKRFTPPLKPSVAPIDNYTAWCRGTDGAGNVESTFVRGRNWSTFEVAKP